MKSSLAAALGLLLVLTATLHSQDAPRPFVAVNALEGRGITEGEAATLTDVLRNELINTGKYRVMERGEMESVLKEQGFQSSGACSDEACMVEMGQLLGAELLVAGSIGKVGKAYSVNVRFVSIKTGEITTNVSHNYTGPIEDLLTREIKIVAQKLAGIAPANAMPAAQAHTPTPKEKKERNCKPIVIGAVAAGVLAAGGAAAYFLVPRDEKDPEDSYETTEVELQW